MSYSYDKPEWMKAKGYLHLTPSLLIQTHWTKYKSKIETPDFIKSYAFYPLIHAVIKERKFKKGDSQKHKNTLRSHSHVRTDNDKVEKSTKERPLHYASHFDALIYSYYASLLNEKYEAELQKNESLDKAVIAYRKIKITPEEDKGKSTIHFAKEVFDEIEQRAQVHGEVGVLAFDIKSFFSSLSHTYLKQKWIDLVGENEFERHHFNIFKSCTNFNYVLLDDLRKCSNSTKRLGYDESKLAKIRRENGYKCFFESNEDFRMHIKEGKLRIYKNPFYNKHKKESIGIPQGLPLSAVLANLYLIDFDKWIIDNIVSKYNAFYRRYSDDLIIICSPDKIDFINTEINRLIKNYELKISEQKTERFIFNYKQYSKTDAVRLSCTKLLNDGTEVHNTHMTYLGFEFRGYNTTIKATNLAKYYRRIISVIKRRSRRAYNAQRKDPSLPLAIYLNQVKQLINKPIKSKDSDRNELKQSKRGNYQLIQKPNGNYKIEKFERKIKSKNSNYYGYVEKCSKIFGSDVFLQQIRKRKKITYQAMKKHLSKYL